MLLCIFFWSCSCSYFYMVQMALHQPLFSFMIIFYLRWFQKHLCYGSCYLTMVVTIITLSFAIINNLIHKAFPNLGFFLSLSNRIIGAKHPGILTFFWSITQNCFVKGSNWLIYPQPFMKLQWAYLFLKTASCFFDYWWIWMFSSLLSGCILGCFSKIQIWSFAFLLRNPPCPYCAYTLDKVLWSIMGVSTCEHTCDTHVNLHLNQRHIF